MRRALAIAALLAASCGDDAPPREPEKPIPAARPQPPLTPPAPGRPGGLPDDRTPLSEAPDSANGAQAAADVLQTYYALIEAGKYEDAFRLREPGKRGPTLEQFAASFDRYSEHHANIGRPSEIAGAAGSLYVEVPIQIYGRLKTGKPFSTAGTVTLRRSNGAPGGSREWRIYGG